jgi:hypothetical protein
MYDVIARPLQFYYELWPSYAGAITLLTLTVMLVLLPLTLKGTRSMLAMQRLQPELKKLQNEAPRRSAEAERGGDEVLQGEQHQPGVGLPAAAPADAGVHHLVPHLHDLLNRAPYGWDMGAASVRARAINGGERGGCGSSSATSSPSTSTPLAAVPDLEQPTRWSRWA